MTREIPPAEPEHRWPDAIIDAYPTSDSPALQISPQIRNSIISTIPPTHDGDLKPNTLTFGRLPEFSKLPGSLRFLTLDIPHAQVAPLRACLYENPYAALIDKNPLIRSSREVTFRVNTILDKPDHLQSLLNDLDAAEIRPQWTLSKANSHFLKINGSIGLIETAEQFETPNNQAHLDYQDKLLGLYTQKPEILFESTLPSLRHGPCSFLVLDTKQIGKITDQEELLKVLDYLAILSSSNDFYFCFDQNNNLTVVALHERAVGLLTKWADSLKKIKGFQPHAFLGKGVINSVNQDEFVVEDYLSKSQLLSFNQISGQNPGIYTSQKVLKEIKGSRDETSVLLAPVDQVDDLIKVDIAKITNLNPGMGPDRLIGYEDELKEFKEQLQPDHPTKLILIQGHAGTGKSRLINEAVKNYPNLLAVSMDPASRNIPGFSLVSFIDQLANKIRELLASSLEELPSSVKKLLDFSNQQENEKILEANRNFYILSHYTSQTLEFIEEKTGALLVVIDDIHHIDRFSDGYLMRIIEDKLADESNQTKIVLARRPEQRYASINQDNLFSAIQQNTVISLYNQDGTPKLNFSDPDLARHYALFSLPHQMRVNPENNSYKHVGEWAVQLGNISKTPFEMTAYLHEIVLNPNKYLLAQKDRIDISPLGVEQLEKIMSKELIIYHQENMRELLSAQELECLQAIALIGTKEFSELEAIKFLEQSLGLDFGQAESVIGHLISKGYLKGSESLFYYGDGETGRELSYSIWHENIRDILINNTLNKEQRAELSFKIYNSLKKFVDISTHQKFQVLNYATVSDQKQNDLNFWNEYFSTAANALNNLDNRKLYSLGYATASLLLNDLNLDEFQNSGISRELKILLSGKSIPLDRLGFVILSFFAFIKNGTFLGQFEKVYQGLDLIEKINLFTKLPKKYLHKFYDYGFESAYIQINQQKLDYYFEKLQGDLSYEELQSTGFKAIQLKYNYRKNKIKECSEIIAELEQKGKLHPSVARLQIRIELNQLTSQLMSNYDGDIVLSGLDIDLEQLEKIKDLEDRLKELSGSDKYTGIFSELNQLNPIEELSVLEIRSQLAAMQKKYDQSIALYGETWRLSMQMDIPQQAVYSAKQRGDVEVIKALAQQNRENHSLLYRQNIRNAVHTYQENGINIAEKLSDKTFLFLLSVQQLRSICLLVSTYHEQEWGQNQRELFMLINRALNAISLIASEPWSGLVPKSPPAEYSKADYEVAYYITPLLTWFRTFCEKMKFPFEIEKTPFEQDFVITGVEKFAGELKNDQLGEVQRKLGQLKSK